MKFKKINVLNRKPLNAFVRHTVNNNFVFQFKQNVQRSEIVSFLELFHQTIYTNEEKHLIKQLRNRFTQIQLKKIKYSEYIVQCCKLTIEGLQYGFIYKSKSIVRFVSVLNSTYSESSQFLLTNILYITPYRYNFKHIGVQIFFHNEQPSMLLLFESQKERQIFFTNINTTATKKLDLKLNQFSAKWQQNKITNYQYLIFLNLFGNRSFNDLSQYPIFPWILHSYNTNFDLNDKEILRDLTKPIGALNKHRLRRLKDKYEQQSKFKANILYRSLYPTHYSTSYYTRYFLIRKIPSFLIQIQYDMISPPDRIFDSIEKTYYNTLNSDYDFKELIPEFYSTDTDFLVNSNNMELGNNNEQQLIDDVKLPKWGKNAHEFLSKMREALQSKYVSNNLNQWIDLIFGYKQTGKKAFQNNNLFNQYCYEQNINWQKQMTQYQKIALIQKINKFGQIPIKLFMEKHKPKNNNLLLNSKQNINDRIKILQEQNQQLKQKQIITKNNMEKIYTLINQISDKQKSRKNQFLSEDKYSVSEDIQVLKLLIESSKNQLDSSVTSEIQFKNEVDNFFDDECFQL